MRNGKKFVVIIPALGGSERFPRKNTHPLKGKPLIAWPIDAAKKSKLVDRIIVSTDSKKIADVARQYGAEIPFMRPARLATHSSPVINTIFYTVKKLADEYKYRCDYVILLQAASPLITSKYIDKAIRLAEIKKADSVVAVSQVNTVNHPYNIREIFPDGTIKFWKERMHYENLGKNKPPFYHAGALWLSSYDTLLKKRKLEGKKNYPLIVNPFYMLDIDYKKDLEYIEALLDYKNK